jgi:hypothetical protein
MTAATVVHKFTKKAWNQQFTGRPDASVGQLGGSGCRGVNMLPVVALMPLADGTDPVACGPEASGGGALDEKMLTLPARTPVGCVTSPEIDAVGCCGCGGKALAAELACGADAGDGAILACCRRAVVETSGSTYLFDAVAALLAGWPVEPSASLATGCAASAVSVVFLVVMQPASANITKDAAASRLHRGRKLEGVAGTSCPLARLAVHLRIVSAASRGSRARARG